MTKDETMAESSIQFWSDKKRNQNSGLAEATFFGRKPRDLTYDALDKFKNSLPCPRIFLYSKSPKRAIYMLFGKRDNHYRRIFLYFVTCCSVENGNIRNAN